MVLSFDVPRIEAELATLGVPVAHLCRKAGVNTSTWQRWKSGIYEPRQATIRQIAEALEALRLDAQSQMAAA